MGPLAPGGRFGSVSYYGNPNSHNHVMGLVVLMTYVALCVICIGYAIQPSVQTNKVSSGDDEGGTNTDALLAFIAQQESSLKQQLVAVAKLKQSIALAKP